MTQEKLIHYRKCVINKLLKLHIEGCSLKFDNDCDDCNKDVLFINALVNQLEYCMDNKLTKEAETIDKLLSKRCGKCNQCPD